MRSPSIESIESLMGDLSMNKEKTAHLIYASSKTYMRPTKNGNAIPGYLSIFQSRDTNQVQIGWIPQYQLVDKKDYESYVLVDDGCDVHPLVHLDELQIPSSAVDHTNNLSASHEFLFPIDKLYAVMMNHPKLVNWLEGSLTFQLYEGISFPPIYFSDSGTGETESPVDSKSSNSDWGGQKFLDSLELVVKIIYSRVNSKLVLVNPSKADTEAHSSASPFPDDLSNLPSGYGNDISMSFLGPLSKVTQGARIVFNRAAQKAASSIASNTTVGNILRQTAPEKHEFLKRVGGINLKTLQDTAGLEEFDPKRVQLARWAHIIAEEAERSRRAEALIGSSTISPSYENTIMGPFELVNSSYNLTIPNPVRSHRKRPKAQAEMEDKPNTSSSDEFSKAHDVFENEPNNNNSIDPNTQQTTAHPVDSTESTESGTYITEPNIKKPISLDQWESFFSQRTGQLKRPVKEIQKLIFANGLASETRPYAWPFLLGVYSWESTISERRCQVQEMQSKWENLQKNYANTKEKEPLRFTEESHRIKIDCRRTDRQLPLFALESEGAKEHIQNLETLLLTYVFEDNTRNYVQGMSDLLSPLYVVCQYNMPLVYACFSKYMKRMQRNFSPDQMGIQSQLTQLQHLIAVMDATLYRHFEKTGSLNLFFCFRWILCNFKRELPFEETQLLWENLWSDHLGSNFHLFIALAILEKSRLILIRYLNHFDEILKFVNDLSMQINISDIIDDAEVLYLTFAEMYKANPSINISSQVPFVSDFSTISHLAEPFQGPITKDPHLSSLLMSKFDYS